MIVGRPHGFTFSMGQLSLNNVRRELMLIEDGAGRGAEPMPRCPAVIPHAVEGVEDGVLAHGLESVPRAGEDQWPLTSNVVDLL